MQYYRYLYILYSCTRFPVFPIHDVGIIAVYDENILILNIIYRRWKHSTCELVFELVCWRQNTVSIALSIAPSGPPISFFNNFFAFYTSACIIFYYSSFRLYKKKSWSIYLLVVWRTRTGRAFYPLYSKHYY